MEYDNTRTIEEVDVILHYAKLGAGDVLPTVQCLSFVQSLDNDSLRLLEVDQDILNAITAGEVVTIRGEKADSAVLCTRNKTYDLREAETSNNLLFLPECSLASDIENVENRTLIHRKVTAMKQDYLELRQIRPRLKRLKHLLEENIFAGKELEQDDEHMVKKYTWEDIQNTIQASDEELMRGLQNLNACQIDGYWRMLDLDFIDSILNNVLLATEENSMDFTAVKPYQVCEALADLYPRHIIEHVIRFFSDQKILPQDFFSPSPFKEDETIRLSEDKICRFVAENLLKLNEKYNLSEFEKVWEAAVPSGMKVGFHQLEGMALIDRDSQTNVIRYYPVSELPEGIEERFSALFRTKAKWTMEDIKPYIEDLATEKMSVGVLLTKHARASTLGGIKVYNSRKLIT